MRPESPITLFAHPFQIEDASFRLHDQKLLVDGSFVTEAHVVAVFGSGKSRTFVNASFWASELNEDNWGWCAPSESCGMIQPHSFPS